MTKRIELFVAVLDRLEKPANKVSAAAAIHGQFNTNQQGFSLVVQTGQTASSVASVLSVTQLTHGAVPFINIATNTMSGTLTFLKIIAEYKAGNKINSGDVISLVGNVAGTIASFTLLAGAAPLTVGIFTGIALTATALSIFQSDLAKNLHSTIAPILSNLARPDKAKKQQAQFLPTVLLTPAAHTTGINQQTLITTVNWDPKAKTVTLGTKKIEFFIEEKFYTGPTGGSSSGAPHFEPRPSPKGAALTISIESLNGKKVNPAPSIKVNFDDEQDSYCCAGSQQDQYH